MYIYNTLNFHVHHNKWRMYVKNIYRTLMWLEQLEQNRMKVKKLQALM